jgi:uncharacterized protein (TIGR02145 family)
MPYFLQRQFPLTLREAVIEQWAILYVVLNNIADNMWLIRRILITIIVTFVTILSSCIKDEPVPVLVDDGTVMFVCEDAQPATKTTLNGLQTEWVANTDKVGLFCQQASKTAGGATGVVNEPLTALANGARSQFSGSVFWNIGDHNFYSYYPYAAGTPPYTAVPVSLKSNQGQSQVNNSDSLAFLDFLVAQPYTAKYPGTSGAAATVSLRYNHLFSIIEFQIKRTTGSGSIKKVRLRGTAPLAFGSGTINLAQSVPASGTPYMIENMTNTSKSVTVELGTVFSPTNVNYDVAPKVYMVVLPGVHTGELNIGFEINGVYYEVSRSNVIFERGKKYTIQVNVGDASQLVIKGSDLEQVTIGNIIWAPLNLGYRSGLEYGFVFQWFRSNGFEAISALEPKTQASPLWAVDLDQETAADKYKEYVLTTGAIPNDWMPVKQTEWNMSRKFNPCPEGWRVPTRSEFDALIASGSTAVTNPILGVDNLIGRWYGPNHDNPDERAKTAVFLPVTYTVGTNGGARVTSNTNSYYWTTSATGTNNRDGVVLYFSPSSTTINTQGRERANGCAIRCVKDINPSVIPILYTIKPSEIKYDGAIVGGYIEYQGSHPITERGVFYGTAVDPAVNKVIASTAGVGEFSVLLTRLESNKVYFVRAYAKNSAGTTYYGDQYKFTTLASQVADYGGQEVTISGVTWAPWNAGYVEGMYPYGLLYQWGRKYGQTYNDSPTPNESPAPTRTNGTTTAAIANGYNTRDVFYAPTGGFYDWNSTAQTSGIWNVTSYNPCPSGWRPPTTAQMASLISSGSTWTDSGPGNVKGRWYGGNHSGDRQGSVFLPASGFRTESFSVLLRDSYGYYWAIDIPTNPSHTSYSSIIYFTNSNNSTSVTYRSTGASVRCVKE